MPTLGEIVSLFLARTGIGFEGTLDMPPAGQAQVKDSTLLADINRGSAEFQRWWIWLPLESGDDEVKPAALLDPATGTLATAAPAYSAGVSSVAYRLLKPEWHPRLQVVPLVNRAIDLCWEMGRTVLTVVPNGDAEAASVGGSDSGATTTLASQQANVFEGRQSFRVANSGAGGYHQTDDFDVAAGRDFVLFAWLRIESGTARITVIDRSQGDATLATRDVSGAGSWVSFQLRGTFPASCYRAAVRFGGVEATAVTFWDNLTLYWRPQTRVPGPSWVTQWRDERGQDVFRLYRLRSRTGAADEVVPAMAYDYELVSPSSYQIINIPSDSTPAVFELSWELVSDLRPLRIEARRPLSYTGPLTTDQSTTAAPLRAVVAAMNYLAASDRGLPDLEQKYRAEFEREQRRISSAVLSPPPDQPRPGGLAWMRLR